MKAQVADVSNTLGSVYQMIKAGNKVHFESGLCYIEHIRTGERTPMIEKNGAFEVGIWVPRACAKQSQQADHQSAKSVIESCPRGTLNPSFRRPDKCVP